MTEAESSTFFKKNIAIFDARVRSVDSKSYVRELYLANFAEESWDKNMVGFEGTAFQDNGEGNDLKAGDGVFTSIEQFNYNDKIVYNSDLEIYSVLDVVISSPEFKHAEKLNELASTYQIRDNNAKARAEISLECDVELCSTGCIADWVWSGFGCICVSNCRGKIALSR